MLGLWAEAPAARRVRVVLSPVLQASLAAALAWYVAHNLLGHAQPFFAPIAAAVALSTSHVQRARRTAQMVVGVLLGIGVAELLHPLVGSSAISIGIVVLVTLLLAVAVGVGFVGEGMMFFNQAAASAILVIALHKSGTGAERAVDALVGGAVALLIGSGLFPVDPLRLLWNAERGVLHTLRGILEHGPPPPSQGHAGDSDSDWVLDASHDLHRQLTVLTNTRSTARATVRVAPRRMRMGPVVEREEARGRRIYVLASALLSLMRTVIDVRELGAAVAPECLAEIDQLAGALRILSQAPRPWPEEVVAEVTQGMRELLRQPHARGSPEDALVTLDARRVARDVIALLPERPTKPGAPARR